MSIGVIIGKKIKLFENLLHAEQARAAGYGVSHTPIHCAEKAQTEHEVRHAFTGWSTQHDRHGAFKPKPRYAQFRLVT